MLNPQPGFDDVFKKPATRSRSHGPILKKTSAQFIETCVDSNLRINARIKEVCQTPVHKASTPRVMCENLGKRLRTSVSQNSRQDSHERSGMPSCVLFDLKK